MRISPPSSRGFSLIEMMIALLIFSIGLLALALLHVKGLSLSRDAALRSQAIQSARTMAEAIKANPEADYATAGINSAPAPGGPCPFSPGANAPNSICACQRVPNDYFRTFESMRTLASPAAGYRLIVEPLPPAAGPVAVRNGFSLADAACWRPTGSAYKVTVRWREGGGSSLVPENDQSIAILVLP
jgi:type IV pilus modification protein PilV